MTRETFLNQLDRSLRSLPVAVRKDILYDYEEHIRIAMENGSTEEEAILALGKPKVLAKELLAVHGLQQAEEHQTARNVLRATLAVVSLGFFNVVVMAGPLIGACAVLVALYACAAALILFPFFAGLGIAFRFVHLGTAGVAQDLFYLFMVEGIGLLLLSLGVWLTRMGSHGLISYLRYNVRVVKGESSV